MGHVWASVPLREARTPTEQAFYEVHGTALKVVTGLSPVGLSPLHQGAAQARRAALARPARRRSCLRPAPARAPVGAAVSRHSTGGTADAGLRPTPRPSLGGEGA